MKAETWMTGEEALAEGLVDELTEGATITAVAEETIATEVQTIMTDVAEREGTEEVIAVVDTATTMMDGDTMEETAGSEHHLERTLLLPS